MIDRHQKRLYRARKEKTSYMNNTKWFKFFSAMQRIEIFLPESQIKFLASDTTHQFNFEIGFNEKGVLDGLACGPFLFNEIEWIFIPVAQEYERFNRDEKLQSTFRKVDLPVIVEALNKSGQYKFDIDENGLKLYGYQ